MRVWILYLLLVASITISVFARFCETFLGDVWVIERMQDYQSSALTHFMKGISLIGKSEIMLTLATALAGSLITFRQYREGFTAVGGLVIMLFLPLFKLIIDRPRPDADLVGMVGHNVDPGFPSGHTYHSLMIFGFLICMASVYISKMWLRRGIQILLGLMILTISFSRVYLGHHWPSDVLGSYVIGGFFLTLLIWMYYNKKLPPRFRRKPKA